LLRGFKRNHGIAEVAVEITAGGKSEARAGEIAVVGFPGLGGNFQAVEVLFEDEVNNTCYGVRTVNRRCTTGNDFDAVDQLDWNRVDVNRGVARRGADVPRPLTRTKVRTVPRLRKSSKFKPTVPMNRFEFESENVEPSCVLLLSKSPIVTAPVDLISSAPNTVIGDSEIRLARLMRVPVTVTPFNWVVGAASAAATAVPPGVAAVACATSIGAPVGTAPAAAS
jgi:hypothetical protein